MRRRSPTSFALLALLLSWPGSLLEAGDLPEWLSTGKIEWRSGPPVQEPAERPEDPCVAVKDPTVVFHEGRWHLFTTIRSEKRSHQIEYSSFADWDEADRAQRHVLDIHAGYFCAPQVFYFTPHKKWYLIHQAAAPGRKVELQPAYSTNDDLSNPRSWTEPKFLYAQHPENVDMWIDFWVICDKERAHLFFTSLNGKMWRAETGLDQFPEGWSAPKVVLEADLFEASHTYKLGDTGTYLTVVEAQGHGVRYFKAYMAEKLDGDWKPVADTWEKPFAGASNVSFDGLKWAEAISHGELLRSGFDEKLEIDPMNLRFLFQGARKEEMQGRAYGKIPWRLGLLEQAMPGQ